MNKNTAAFAVLSAALASCAVTPLPAAVLPTLAFDMEADAEAKAEAEALAVIAEAEASTLAVIAEAEAEAAFESSIEEIASAFSGLRRYESYRPAYTSAYALVYLDAYAKAYTKHYAKHYDEDVANHYTGDVAKADAKADAEADAKAYAKIYAEALARVYAATDGSRDGVLSLPSNEEDGFALASTLAFVITIHDEEEKASIRSNAAECIPRVCEDPSLVKSELVQPARGLIE